MRRRYVLLAVAAMAAFGALPSAASAATSTFSNTAAIAIPDLDNAEPSVITVSGMTGVVTDVNVFLNGVSHTQPDDMELLMVAPFGQSTVLMNDAGGTADISGLNVSFNDQAGGQVPDAGPVAAQGYKPSDYATQPGLEAFIAPAPPPPYGLTLAGSQGTDPNGTWTLYADDDAFDTFTGSIAGGWSVSITTTNVPPATTPTTPTTATKKCKKKKKKHRSAAAAKKKKCKKKRK